MIYNISLVFDETTNTELGELRKRIEPNLNSENLTNEHSVFHTTLVKFETQSELSKSEQEKLIQYLPQEFLIDFSGITILPSSKTGCWIEIATLKNKQLAKAQEKILENLRDATILSGTDDEFRPHITLAKVTSGSINVQELDYNILRKRQVPSKITLREL